MHKNVVKKSNLNFFFFLKYYQTRPAFHPEGLAFAQNEVSLTGEKPMTQLWHQNGRCPEDTIPIRRTKKSDVLRASSLKRYGKKRHRSTPNPLSVDPDMLNESGHQVLLLTN